MLGEQDSFHVNHVYKDEDTYTVVAAASEVLGKSTLALLQERREGGKGRERGY